MAVHHVIMPAMLLQNSTTQKTPFEQMQSAYLLHIELDKAKKEICHLRSEQQQFAIRIASLEEENARLKEQLQLAQQRHFGKKRDTGELPPSNEPSQQEQQTVAGYTRQKKKKSCGHLVDLSG